MDTQVKMFRAACARPASVLRVHPQPKGDLLSSNLQLKPAGLPGESWPRGPEGKPLLFLGQFNLTDAPYVPFLLQDVQFITLFVSPESTGGERWIKDSTDGDEVYAIRRYSSTEQLVPLDIPEDYPYRELPGSELLWEVTTDFPTCEDPERPSPAEMGFAAQEDLEENPFCLCSSNVAQSKMGGYVTMFGYLQEFFFADEGPMLPVLQVMAHPELQIRWGSKSGGIHVFRGAEPGLRHLWKLHQEIS